MINKIHTDDIVCNIYFPPFLQWPKFSSCMGWMGLDRVGVGFWYVVHRVGWRNVPKRCVPVRKFWDPSWHNVPGLIHPCHSASYNTLRSMQNDRDVSIKWHCVSGTMNFGDQGSYSKFVRGHIVSGRPFTPPSTGRRLLKGEQTDITNATISSTPLN